MRVNRIDHICIAVRSFEQALRVWGPVLGKHGPDDRYVDESEKIRVCRYWLGEVGFELMEFTSSDGEVARFIEKHGEGVMLISLNVNDTRASMAELQRQNYPFLPGPRPFRDCELAFIHPKKMNGVLEELIDDMTRAELPLGNGVSLNLDRTGDWVGTTGGSLWFRNGRRGRLTDSPEQRMGTLGARGDGPTSAAPISRAPRPAKPGTSSRPGTGPTTAHVSEECFVSGVVSIPSAELKNAHYGQCVSQAMAA